MKKKKLPTLCDACDRHDPGEKPCPFRYTPKERRALKGCSEFRRFK